jgi:hypothetical protein
LAIAAERCTALDARCVISEAAIRSGPPTSNKRQAHTNARCRFARPRTACGRSGCQCPNIGVGEGSVT